MSPSTVVPTPGPAGPGLSCAEVEERLRALERRLDAPPEEPLGPAGEACPSVRAHLAGCPACARRHGARAALAEGRLALRAREVPPDALAGLYDAVRSRAPYALPSGGMSPAFLDVPRSLRAWRAVAVAACVLLALGAGFTVSGTFGPPASHGRSVPLHDAHPGLLRSLDVSLPERGSAGPLRPLPVAGPRGHGGFFLLAPPPADRPGEPDWN